MVKRVLLALTLGVLAAGCESPDNDSAETGARHVELAGQPNFRDLGGYRTGDGRTVKWGEVYRSGELPELTDADVAVLEGLELQAVANFLLPEEIEKHGRDRLPEGVREILLPITSDGMTEIALGGRRAMETGDFSALPPEVNLEVHRLLLDDATEQYAALLRALIDPNNRPMAFHCSHGVHRTGTAAAVLLSALGVPWETVREDYLLSNVYREEEVTHRLAQIRKMVAAKKNIPPEQVDMANMEAFYIQQGTYIDASLDRAVEEYGSMQGYIREGLGITDKEIAQLRAQLLQ